MVRLTPAACQSSGPLEGADVRLDGTDDEGAAADEDTP